MGMVRVTSPIFFKFHPNHIFGISEAKHFKLRVLTDTQEYWCTHYILPSKRDVFGVTWEISDHISETVQDRNIVERED